MTTCTDIIIDGRTCNFHVQSAICGNITGNTSSSVVTVLKGESAGRTVRIITECTNTVPDSPSMTVVPYYYDSGILGRLVVRILATSEVGWKYALSLVYSTTV